MAEGSGSTHYYGGRDLVRLERSWPGLDVDLVRWQAMRGTTGITERPQHVLFTTLAGSTGRAVAVTGDGGRYEGADFPGAVTFVPAMHRRHTRYSGGLTDYLAIRLPPQGIQHLLDVDGDRLEFRGFTNQPDPFLYAMSVALRDQVRARPGAADHLLGDSVANTLCAYLVRRYSNLASAALPRSLPIRGSALRRVLAYIDEHLDQDLRIATLAAVAGAPPHTFSRAFKAATGLPPHRYVIKRRLDRAARLLGVANGLPISEIAFHVGLSSQSHLTTAFRRRYGLTPLAYRRQARL